MEIKEKSFEKDGKTIKFKYIEVEGEEYRIPNIVLSTLKSILEEKPDMKYFKVKRDGEGLKTKYTVVTLD